MQQLGDKIWRQAHQPVSDQLREQVRWQAQDQIWRLIAAQVEARVWGQVQWQVRDQIQESLNETGR
jgi:hypothetical protein